MSSFASRIMFVAFVLIVSNVASVDAVDMSTTLIIVISFIVGVVFHFGKSKNKEKNKKKLNK